MSQSRVAGGHAMGAARELTGAARHAAHAAGQAACAALAEHNLGASAYAIKGACAGNANRADVAGRLECEWQREQLPDAIRVRLVEDQRRPNDICRHVFHFAPG